MTTAAAANELNHNIGFDLSLVGELADWEAEQAAEVEDDTAARQTLNQAMFDFLYS